MDDNDHRTPLEAPPVDLLDIQIVIKELGEALLANLALIERHLSDMRDELRQIREMQ